MKTNCTCGLESKMYPCPFHGPMIPAAAERSSGQMLDAAPGYATKLRAEVKRICQERGMAGTERDIDELTEALIRLAEY